MHSSCLYFDPDGQLPAAAKLHGCHKFPFKCRAWATSQWTSALAS